MKGSVMKGFLLSKHNIIRVGIILTILALISQPVLAANANPKVFPPGSHPYGKSLNEWNAEWWKYTFGFPADTSPLTDPTGERCATDQSGPVFFLMGQANGVTVRNECVVPVGKALFFPLMNWVCAVPEDGATFEDIRALCAWVTDYIDELSVTVDGVSLQNLFDYRFPTPPFSFTGAVDNPFDQGCGTPGTCYEGYHEIGFSDGYYVMLAPLSPGEHQIHFYAHFYLPDWNWELEQDVTYNLTIASPGIGR